MNRHGELQKMVNDLGPDFIRFYEKGNKSAGVRIRKAMNTLKKKAQDIRVEIQEIKSKDN